MQINRKILFTALVNLQKACGVDQLKMSEYGFTQMNLKQLRLMQKKPWEVCS